MFSADPAGLEQEQIDQSAGCQPEHSSQMAGCAVQSNHCFGRLGGLDTAASMHTSHLRAAAAAFLPEQSSLTDNCILSHAAVLCARAHLPAYHKSNPLICAIVCLQVLNLGHNALQGQLQLSYLPSLRALMLNDNQLTSIAGRSLAFGRCLRRASCMQASSITVGALMCVCCSSLLL